MPPRKRFTGRFEIQRNDELDDDLQILKALYGCKSDSAAARFAIHKVASEAPERRQLIPSKALVPVSVTSEMYGNVCAAEVSERLEYRETA